MKYAFKIENSTPETMPLGRLVEYYTQIVRMIGAKNRLHLLNIIEGSHISEFSVGQTYRPTIDKILLGLNKGGAPQHALDAKKAISSMLEKDGATGEFSNQTGDNVVLFSDESVNAETAVGIRDTATFTGELYYISGSENEANVRIETDDYGKILCTTTREIAKEMGNCIFEKIRATGRGEWLRTKDGDWRIKDFYITEYTKVRKESLRETVDRIRELDIDWGEDPIGRLRRIEEKE